MRQGYTWVQSLPSSPRPDQEICPLHVQEVLQRKSRADWISESKNNFPNYDHLHNFLVPLYSPNLVTLRGRIWEKRICDRPVYIFVKQNFKIVNLNLKSWRSIKLISILPDWHSFSVLFWSKVRWPLMWTGFLRARRLRCRRARDFGASSGRYATTLNGAKNTHLTSPRLKCGPSSDGASNSESSMLKIQRWISGSWPTQSTLDLLS